MEATARNVDAAPTEVVFEDGLGVRFLVTGPSGEPSGETLVIRPALVGARSFEFALRERVARLSTISHPALPKLRAVDRTTGPDPTLRLISERVQGTRLSVVLDQAQAHDVHLDIGAALAIIRQLVAAVATLHESARDLSHGAIALERIVITPDGRVIVVEHGLGAALQQLRFTSKRYWSELRVALPPTAGPVLFDQRVDVVQLGVVALGLLLGRSLRDTDVPNRTGELVGAARAVSLRGDVEPLPSGLRRWLGRALQLDPLRSFSSALDARAELDALLEATDEHASLISLEAFLERLERATAPELTEAFPREAATPPPTVPSRELDLAGIDAAFEKPGRVSKITMVIDPPDDGSAPTVVTNTPARRAIALQPSDLQSSAVKPSDAKPGDVQPTALEPIAPQPSALQPTTLEPIASQLSALQPIAVPPIGPRQADTLPVPPRQPDALVLPAASAAAFSVLAPPVPVSVPAPMAPVPTVTELEVDAAVAQVSEPSPERANLLTFARPPISARPALEDAEALLPESVPVAATATVAPRDTLRMDAIDAAMDAFAGATAARASTRTASDGRESATTEFLPPPVAARSGLTRAVMAGVVPAVMAAVAGYAAAGGGDFAPVRAMRPGVVTLTTGPAGVEAYVDGVYRGLTPLTVSLTPGPHAIDLQREAAEPVTVPITLSPGMKVSQFVDMPLDAGFGLNADGTDAALFTELPGRLVDTGSVSVVSDAVLQIVEGGTVQGTSRDTLELPVGRHELTLIDDASGIYTTRSVLVDAKKPAVLKVALPTGVLAVSATPRAEVWVDGDKRGETPIQALTLRAGAHDVVFRHPDLGDRKQAVVVTAGDVLRLNVDLRGK